MEDATDGAGAVLRQAGEALRTSSTKAAVSGRFGMEHDEVTKLACFLDATRAHAEWFGRPG